MACSAILFINARGRRFLKLLRVAGVVALVATSATALAIAQTQAGTPPGFEVASIRPFQGLGTNVTSTVSGPHITITEYGLLGLIMESYRLEPWQISGGPAWLETDLFNIAAKAPGDGTPTGEQVRQMLQTLLADRFKLRVHREKKERPVYALVIGKRGPRLKQSASADSTFMVGGGLRTVQMGFRRQTMEFLAQRLSNNGDTGRTVLDKTGLTGTYDFELSWNPGNDTVAAPDSNAISLFTALEEQLGLRLEPQKAPVEMLVIDHAEKPTPN